MIHNKIEINSVVNILDNLKHCIENKIPFSLIRLGDGGIKLIDSFLNSNYKQLELISDKEGIPLEIFKDILILWKNSINISDYIDCPEVYFGGNFWERTKGLNKKKINRPTLIKLKNWKKYYQDIGISNTNYCNPEINFLMCLTKFRNKSLPNLIENKKLCFITCRNDIQKILPYDVDVLKIVGFYEKQYYRSFKNAIKNIEHKAKNYDLWLVSAGELGRIYTGLIKFCGGRALDIGSLIDFWCTKEIPSRLKSYITTTLQNPLKLTLTESGKEYQKFI